MENKQAEVRVPYFKLPGLEDIYLEDSWVEAIEFRNETLGFRLDLILRETHPLYTPPKPNEIYSYHRCYVLFCHVRKLTWLEMRMSPTVDIDGTADFGNIDWLEQRDGDFWLEGGWGTLIVESDSPFLAENKQARELFGHRRPSNPASPPVR